LTKKSNLTGRH